MNCVEWHTKQLERLKNGTEHEIETTEQSTSYRWESLNRREGGEREGRREGGGERASYTNKNPAIIV